MAELDRETRDRLRRVSTATLTTQLFKRGLRNLFMQGVRPLGPVGENLVGPAFTLRFIPAREDLDQLAVFTDPMHPQRHAIEITPPDHVLVIDARGDTRAASGGQILMTRLKARGVAGMVSDGAIRDAGPISKMDFPAFCAGPAAPLNLVIHHAADLNIPIGCGGVPVFPGDIVVGDADGVVVLPRAIAAEVAHDAAEQEHLEEFVLERVAGGAALPGTYPPDDATKAAYEAWKKAPR
jgi:regulator of RNase E activity RraA